MPKPTTQRGAFDRAFSCGRLAPAISLLLVIGIGSLPAAPEPSRRTELALFLEGGSNGILPPRNALGDVNGAFLRALIRGDLGSLLPEGCRNYSRLSGQIRFSCRPTSYEVRLSQNLIRATHGTLIATLAGDIPLRVQVSDQVIVHFAVMNTAEGPIVRIDSIQGLSVTQNQRFRLVDLDRFLDVHRYRIIVSRNHFFAGVLGDPHEQRFDYYIYSSEADLRRRTLRDILRRSDESVRATVRPYVLTFPDFEV